MKKQRAIYYCSRYTILNISLGLLMIISSVKAYGQELPPRPIAVTVSVLQNLNFGTFYHGNGGGSVIIYPDGSRSATGDVILLPGSFSTGLYDIVANTGTIISLLGVNSLLTGSNSGSMTLQIGNSDPPGPFIITSAPPNATQVRIGGTLIVGDPIANPPGNYSGFFNVTFFQE
jgi:hypothetical protein